MAAETTPALPAPEAETPDPAILHINPDINVREQILSQAHNRGRTNETGLTFTAGDMAYEVADVHTEYRYEPVVKWAPKAIRHIGNHNKQQEGRHITHLPEVPVGTEYVTIRGYYPNGELRSRRQMTTGEFGAFLNDLVRGADMAGNELPTFRLGDLQPEEPAADMLSIPVDLSTPNRSTYSKVLDTIELQRLARGMVGLTWTRDGLQRQVIEDDSYVDHVHDGPKIERRFTIETTNPNEPDPTKRIVGRVSLSTPAMHKYFEALARSPLDDLHFEVPDSPRGIIRDTEARVTGEEITDDKAIWFLSYGDRLEEDHPFRKALEGKYRKQLGTDEGSPFVSSLKDMVKDVGFDCLITMAENMVAQYLATTQKFGMESDENDINRSLSWAFTEMARRRNLFEHPNLINRDLEGDAVINDSVGNRPSAIITRRNIVDAHVAAAYKNLALTESIGLYPTRKPKKVEDHLRMPDGAEHELVETFEPVVAINHKITNLLPSNIRDDILAILDKATHGRTGPGVEKKARRITAGEYAHVGALLGRVAGQRLMH